MERNLRKKQNEKFWKKLKKVVDLELIIWYITYAPRKSAKKWSLKTEQNVNFCS